jgi:hypothetical protein
MTNSLESESDPAYLPSSSPTASSSLPRSNYSSCKLVDMAPKRSRQRATHAIAIRHGRDNPEADQAGPSGINLELQEMRSMWEDIRDINNLLWVPASW